MGKKLTIYMIDGKEYGPRTIEIGNWSGMAVYSPRSMLTNIINRKEFIKPGVYCLRSIPEDDTYDEKIYIGEAEVIKDRIKRHLTTSNRDFTEILFFVSKDELLTKAHIKYLEARIIELAKKAKTAQIENRQIPNKPMLHEADVSDMEYFLEQIKLILPVMGFRFLLESVLPEESSLIKNESTNWNIKSKKFSATMQETEKGFVVKKGSEANARSIPSFGETYKNFRKKLIESESLIKKNESKLEFTEDVIFTSLTAASNVILGRSTAGPIYWLDDNKKTYKKYQEEILNNNTDENQPNLS